MCEETKQKARFASGDRVGCSGVCSALPSGAISGMERVGGVAGDR